LKHIYTLTYTLCIYVPFARVCENSSSATSESEEETVAEIEKYFEIEMWMTE